MNSGLIGVLAGAMTSLAIKGVDLVLTHEKDKRVETVQDRDRLSSDIWKLLGELRSDYARLDAELKDERTARHEAQEQAREMGVKVSHLQDQVARQEAKTEKYKVLAEERLNKISTLTRAVLRLQARVNELEVRDGTEHSAEHLEDALPDAEPPSAEPDLSVLVENMTESPHKSDLRNHVESADAIELPGSREL